MRELTPEPLTAEAFAPFGSVIEASDEAVQIDINQGHAVRYDRLAEIDVADEGGVGVISLFRARPLARAGADDVRAPSAGQPELRAAERAALSGRGGARGAFRCSPVRLFPRRGHQGVHYRKGVWHHFLLVLDAESDFLVVGPRRPRRQSRGDRAGALQEIRVRPLSRIGIRWMPVGSLSPRGEGWGEGVRRLKLTPERPTPLPTLPRKGEA
jgi:ureidoglycolate lyase